MFTALYNRLASLTVGLWLMGGVMLAMAVGSFLQGEGSSINDMPLFAWLQETPTAESWWLWLCIGLLVLLVVNTLLCSWESLRQKWQRGSFLTRIAPQVMHLGFLLIVVAHLLSASGGMKAAMPLREGSTVDFPDGHQFQIMAIDAAYGKMGMPTAMSARLRESGTGRETIISPNHPLFYQGFGIYLKDVALEPVPGALIEVHREPGAATALAGAFLFTLANLVLLAKRRGRQE